MTRKFYLEKYLNSKNIESYTINQLDELFEVYHKYIKDNEGKDISFPGIELKLSKNAN